MSPLGLIFSAPGDSAEQNLHCELLILQEIGLQSIVNHFVREN